MTSPVPPSLPFSRTHTLGPQRCLPGDLVLAPDGGMPEGLEAQAALVALGAIAGRLQ